MEVGSVNAIPLQTPKITKNMPAESQSSGIELPVNVSAEIKIDYEKVIMDSEEVKNFLFMLIGADNSRISAKGNKGSNVNVMA